MYCRRLAVGAWPRVGPPTSPTAVIGRRDAIWAVPSGRGRLKIQHAIVQIVSQLGVAVRIEGVVKRCVREPCPVDTNSRCPIVGNPETDHPRTPHATAFRAPAPPHRASAHPPAAFFCYRGGSRNPIAEQQIWQTPRPKRSPPPENSIARTPCSSAPNNSFQAA